MIRTTAAAIFALHQLHRSTVGGRSSHRGRETRLNDDAVTALWYRYADVAGFTNMFASSEGR